MNNEAAVNRKVRTQNRSKLRTTVQIGMLGAVAAVLMFFEFPIPFIAPPFVKMDFSEIPVLVGTFAMGPLAGVFIELLKNLLNLVIPWNYHYGSGRIIQLYHRLCFCGSCRAVLQKEKDKSQRPERYGGGYAADGGNGMSHKCFYHVPVVQHSYGDPHGQLYCYGNSDPSGH